MCLLNSGFPVHRLSFKATEMQLTEQEYTGKNLTCTNKWSRFDSKTNKALSDSMEPLKCSLIVSVKCLRLHLEKIKHECT